MENKKYVSVLLATILLSAQSVSAMSMDDGSMSSSSSDGSATSQTTSASSDDSVSDSEEDASDDSASDNGDVEISDSQVRKGSYDVNGDLRVEGVLYVFGNLDVNGDLVIEKNAKVRVTGQIDVNGDIINNGGSLYASKKSANGGGKNKARKFDSIVAEIDPFLSAKLVGEEREGILQDILDSKGFVRASRLEEFLDSLKDQIEERDVAAFEKVKARLVASLERKIKQMGGLKDKQLDVFSSKLESMPTDKLQKFVDRLEKLQKATKKKRFGFQVSQLKELAEEIIESRSTSADEPTVEVPTASGDTGSTTSSSSGSTSVSTGSGSASVTTSSGTVTTGSGETTASGTTTQQ